MKNERSLAGIFFTTLCYGALVYIMQLFMVKAGMFTQYPVEEALLHWDASFYKSIAYEGYFYSNWISNSGFFVFYAWIWKLLHANAYIMCAFNIVCYATGISLLYKMIGAERKELLLWLTLPSCMFIYVPYPEAFYFMLVTLVMYGIVNKKRWMVWPALFIAAMTRMNTMVMLPALLVMECIAHERKEWYKGVLTSIVHYALPVFAGLGLFLWYQYQATGVWFAYFKMQEQIWGHKFHIPVFPLQTSHGPWLLWLNALGLFICVASLLLMLRAGIQWLAKNKLFENKLLALSAGYFTLLMFQMVLYNHISAPAYTTNLHGLHRYAFVTPFFIIFLHHFTSKVKYTAPQQIGVLALGNLVWMLCGSYEHIQQLLYLNFNCLLLWLYMQYANKQTERSMMILVAIGFFLQVILLQRYLLDIYFPD